MRNYFPLQQTSWYFWPKFILALVLGACVLFPMASYAELQPVSAESAFFTPSSNDQSIIYLGELFGSIPPVLAGTGSGLMGALFKIFNTAIMTLGILFAGYTTFVGILNTAGEGEMLGKGWSSIWIPIRTVAGIALLIPTSSGYCVCQIFMMWILVQGIGAADTLTSKIVDYMEEGQKVFVRGNTPDANGHTTIVTTWDPTAIDPGPIQRVYEALSCMQAYQKQYPEVNSAYVRPIKTINADNTQATYSFEIFKNDAEKGAIPIKSPPIYCGTITLKTNDKVNSTALSYLIQGVDAIIPSLNAAAYFMVNDLIVTNPTTVPPTTTTTPPIGSSINDYNVAKDTFNFVGADFMTQVANTYNSYVIQASNSMAGEGSLDKYDSLYNSIKAYGWISLGNIYWGMAKSEGAASNTDANAIAKLPWSGGSKNIDSNTGDYTSMMAQSYGKTWASGFMTDLVDSRTNANGSFDSTQDSKSNTVKYIANGLASAMVFEVLTDMEKQLSSDVNPIVAAQRLGHSISYDVEAVLTALMIVSTGVALYAGVYSSVNSLFLVYQTIIALALPGLLIFAGAMLLIGGTLSVIIPIMPAMIYFMAVLAWMVATLETIVAAPIVAVALVHPEGQNPVWGKAEPAMMLMINMFLRPSLMVIGMAAGVILSSITMQFVNFGYAQVMDSILNGNAGSKADGTSSMEAMLYLTTYTALILACVNKSFSTIDALPDTVMRWIQGGESTRFGGGQEAMQKLQGTQESGGQKAGGDAMSSGQEARGAGEKAVGGQDKNAERADKKADKEAQLRLGDSKSKAKGHDVAK